MHPLTHERRAAAAGTALAPAVERLGAASQHDRGEVGHAGIVRPPASEPFYVSRRHALIYRDDEGAKALDDRSLNGLFHNGERVELADLSDGD
ncbi:MAG: FHA domain-containing protein, partial [Thermoleophilaceae bacterium]